MRAAMLALCLCACAEPDAVTRHGARVFLATGASVDVDMLSAAEDCIIEFAPEFEPHIKDLSITVIKEGVFNCGNVRAVGCAHCTNSSITLATLSYLTPTIHAHELFHFVEWDLHQRIDYKHSGQDWTAFNGPVQACTRRVLAEIKAQKAIDAQTLPERIEEEVLRDVEGVP